MRMNGLNRMGSRGLGGQTSLVALVLVVMLFAGLLLIISLASGGASETEEYLTFYTNSMLTSILKTDSGYKEYPEYCKSVTELLFCSYYTPTFMCGGTSCGELAGRVVDVNVRKVIRPNMDYHLQYGEKEAGNPAMKEAKQKWMTEEEIYRGTVPLQVTLTLGRK